MPTGAKITNTTYQITPYGNGNASDDVRLCYQQQYTTTDYLCVTMTAPSSGSTPAFNGLDPKGTFVVTHTLHGGTYPASGGTAQDTVKADYQY